MKRWRRHGTGALVAVAALGFGLWMFSGGGSGATVPPAVDADAAATALDDPALVGRGRYLAIAGDCAACHTARDGKPYAGGHALPTPFGDIPAPNITPDAETGIGRWRFEDFWTALHEGKAPDGKLLYPVFPYTSYTRVTRDDALALFAYLRSLPPVHQPNRKPHLAFPYNLRKALLAWRALYFRAGTYRPDPDRSGQWNRGAYLVEGLGHCNECHTTRTSLGGLDDELFLAGGVIPAQGWYAPDLGMHEGGGLEGWSRQDVVDLLKTGRSAHGTATGPMADVVRKSTQHMTDADLQAIAIYLESLPARGAGAAGPAARADDFAAGGEVYARECAACHGQDGRGEPGIHPPLDGNPSVTAPDATNAIRSVLLGGFPPATAGNPAPYSMPPFAARLDDADIAAVVNYIRQSWSNRAAAVTPRDVQRYRYGN